MNEKAAEFRARREACGLSVEDVAAACRADAADVEAWESSEGRGAPSFAWSVVETAENGRTRAVDAAVRAAESFPEAAAIQLIYYASQEQYDAMGRDPGPYGVANANARAIAERLVAMGFDVSWSYPTDPDNIYHQSRS